MNLKIILIGVLITLGFNCYANDNAKNTKILLKKGTCISAHIEKIASGYELKNIKIVKCKNKTKNNLNSIK